MSFWLPPIDQIQPNLPKKRKKKQIDDPASKLEDVLTRKRGKLQQTIYWTNNQELI